MKHNTLILAHFAMKTFGGFVGVTDPCKMPMPYLVSIKRALHYHFHLLFNLYYELTFTHHGLHKTFSLPIILTKIHTLCAKYEKSVYMLSKNFIFIAFVASYVSFSLKLQLQFLSFVHKFLKCTVSLQIQKFIFLF